MREINTQCTGIHTDAYQCPKYVVTCYYDAGEINGPKYIKPNKQGSIFKNSMVRRLYNTRHKTLSKTSIVVPLF